MSREASILTAILVVVVGGMIGLFVAMGGGKSDDTKVADAGKLTRANSHVQGAGKVQIVEFGDFQCPSCAAAHPILKQIKAENPDVSFVFRNFPLTQLHPHAELAAKAAEAAGKQGKFFEMHDILYDKQKEWSTVASPLDAFISYAKSLGLDEAAFTRAIQSDDFKTIIDTDMADGNALGVNSTPTIYVNGTKLSSFDYVTIRDAVNAAKATSTSVATPTPTPVPAQ